MKISDALILAIDTETTGTNCEQDRIVELGGAYIRGGHRWGPSLSSLVNPERMIPPESSKIHRITDEMVTGAPLWPVVAGWLRRHIEAQPLVLVGYNILSFDLPLIHAENRRAGIDWTLPTPLDPYLFARWYHPERQSKLETICDFYGVNLPKDQAHRGDADSIATALLLTAMVWAGYIPDDLEEAHRVQKKIHDELQVERARYGRWLYVDREDRETLRVGLMQNRGVALKSLDESVLKKMMEYKEMTSDGREALRRMVERQSSLF
ncbi:MAG: 3'-5' exonuclease [Myxococcota bacterium]|nr:3'-5' exonuclease [Myxococcota bacterium]